MKILFNALLIIFLFANHLSAIDIPSEVDPPIEIVGTVIERQQTGGVEFATVVLLNAKDSSMVSGTTTKTDGSFLLENVKAGKYLVRVSFIGYQDLYTDVIELKESTEKLDLGTLRLQSGQTLDEVVVRGQKSLIETRIDKRIFNADADLSSKGGTGLNLLGNVPGVENHIDDNISLRGSSNVQILINGRPSTFSPATFLEQVPATSIEKIELITNPGAKYDAEGTAGIINIILKEEEKRGINGSVNGSYQQGMSPRFNSSAALNARTRKWNSSLSYSYTNNEYSYMGTNERRYRYQDTSYLIDEYDEGLRGRSGHNVRGGVDYFMNRKNTIYVSGNYQLGGRSADRLVVYDNYDESGKLNSYRERRTDGVEDRSEYFVNGGWQKKFDKEGHTLDLDMTYSREGRVEDDAYEELYFDEDDDIREDPLLQNITETRSEGLFVGMLDYAEPLSFGGKLEAGLRADLLSLNNSFFSETYEYESGSFKDDEALNNNFFFDQKVFAGYGTYSREWGAYGLKLGLRAEQTYTEGQLEGEDPIKRDYLRLFPTVHNSYQLSEETQFMLSYSRRINRPNSWRLNPFTSFTNPLSLRRGNPYLLPEDIHSLEFGLLQYVGDLTVNASLFYRRTEDVMQRFLIVEEGSPVAIRTYENLGRRDDYGFEGIFNYVPYRWWNLNFTTNISARSLKSVNREGVDNLNTFRVSLNYNSQWRLNGGWSFQVNGRYRAPFDVPQGRIEAYTYVNLAVRKDFLDEKLNIGISVRDVFNTREWVISTTEQSGLTQLRERQWDSRIVGLDVNYRFGRQEKNSDGDRSGGFDGPVMD
jgi:outer membrane receptor protein involved in Fe transport